MKKLIALTGVALVAALLWSAPARGQCACFGYLPAAAGTVQPQFSVPPPDTPDGPSTGFVGQKLTYSTEGTDPLGVHEYMFDWDDGSNLSWKDNDTQSHTYQAAGTYHIRAREKCPLEFFETDWSDTRTVTITGTAGNAWMLSVNSSPVIGVSVTGTVPCVTNYAGPVTKDAQVTLTAPAQATISGTSYVFQRWVLGGVEQTAGVTTLSFQITADVTAQAVYQTVQRNLTVQSNPIVGVTIGGTSGGSTNYSVVIPDNTSVTLTAPATFSDGGPVYGFTGWTGLGTKTETSQTLHLRIRSDVTVTANYGVIDLSLVYPNDAGIVLERGKKTAIQWQATNLPKGLTVKVELVKGGTEVWTLSAGAKKSPLKWTVGAPIEGAAAYPDGDDYKIRVSAVDGAVTDESANPFAIATVQSLFVNGPDTVQGGTMTQYTCTAHYNYGGDVDATSLVKWRCSPTTYAKIKNGLLTTKLVPSDQAVAITASYGKGQNPLTGGLEVTVTP